MQNFNSSLYIVGTPIGNLGDVSKRAVEVLGLVNFVLCEDTRVSEKLMIAIGVHANFIIYNDYSVQKVIPKIIESMKNKEATYALISDAGMPLVSDPGYKLVNACIENEIPFTTVPGPSSVISALILSGFPSDRFMFCGFADDKKFDEISKINSTIIMFESPRRIIKTVQKIGQNFGERKIAVIREITKVFEERIIGSSSEVLDHFSINSPRGEMVIVIEPPRLEERVWLEAHLGLINDLNGILSDSDLSSILSRHLGVSKNSVYNFIKNL